MKRILLLLMLLSFIGCSTDQKLVNSNNQMPANVNKVTPNAIQTPSVVNTNSSINSAVNTTTAGGKDINLGEKFTLKNGEKTKIKGTNFELKVTTAGTMAAVINPETKQVGAGVPYCRIDATFNGKTDGRQLNNEPGKNEFVFEGYKIQVQSIVPTGNISCDFIITKN